MSSEFSIQIRNLGKRYEIYANPRDRVKQAMIVPLAHRLNINLPNYFQDFWAVRHLDFNVRPGETFGIIGKNGSGKSTLLQMIAGIIEPTEGYVDVNGRIAALLELGSGFNAEFTGRENVFLNGQILGLTESEIDQRYDEIVAFADIGAFIDRPVKTYSSGMFLRLAFAVQAHIDASIIIVDEAIAVGDVFFRQKCYARLEKLRMSGASILLVSHSMPDVEQYCDRALLLHAGRFEFLGRAVEAAKKYYMINQHVSASADDLINTITQNNSGRKKLESPSLNALNLEAGPELTVCDGRVTCLGISVTDAQGRACRHFHQGDKAYFKHAYRLNTDIQVPIGGFILSNERGIIVHGKNAWQCANDVPKNLKAGAYVVFEHEVQLNLQSGEYTFEFGFAAVPLDAWDSRVSLSFDDWNQLHETISVATQAGAFSIGLAIENGRHILTHHGVADLPGTVVTRLIKHEV